MACNEKRAFSLLNELKDIICGNVIVFVMLLIMSIIFWTYIYTFWFEIV